MNLHVMVADSIDTISKLKNPALKMERDKACGGVKTLKFFLSYIPSRESTVSQVDLILFKDSKVKLVCEIEESGFHPGKLFGKLFSTASAKACRIVVQNSHQYYELDEDAIFIQIVSSQAIINDKSQKEKQGQIIENEIFHKLAYYNSWIKRYRLIFGADEDFKIDKKGYKELERILNTL